MTPTELRDLIRAIEQLEEFGDWELEKDAGKYTCYVWDDKCRRVWSTGQPTLALAISLVLKKALEGK